MRNAGIRIPILSDFLTRTTAATLSGLNPDGTARRATLVYAPGGKLAWALREGDAAEQHVNGALEFLRAAGVALPAPQAALPPAQGGAGGVSTAPSPSEPRKAINGW